MFANVCAWARAPYPIGPTYVFAMDVLMGLTQDEFSVCEFWYYYAFPEEHWRRIRTNNPLERILREIRRRTRVVGAFPDGQSALNLAAARLRHIAGTAWSTKKYLNIEFLKDQQMTGAINA